MVATCSPVEVAPRGLIRIHRGDRVAEKQVRAKVGGPDGHKAKAGDVRRRPFAANSQDLTACGRAPLGEAARAQLDPAREAVDGPQSDEGAGDRALAVEDGRDGLGVEQRAKRATSLPVERGIPLRPAAEGCDPHGPQVGGEGADPRCDAPVLGDQRSGLDDGEHRDREGDAEDCQQHLARTVSEPHSREPERRSDATRHPRQSLTPSTR